MKCFLSLFVTSLALAAAPRSEPYVPGQIVIQEREGIKQGDINKALAAANAKFLKKLTQTRHDVIQVPQPQVEAVMRYLVTTGLFTVVERDGAARSSGNPNDPNFPSQWHLTKIQAPTAWNTTTGGIATPIAVVDSGIDPKHPDLASRLIPGWNFLGDNSDTHDVLGHGTAVAGVVAAATNNLTGVAGVTWANPIMPLVVLNSSDYASYSDIAAAIMYAADHGARIINVSIGGTSPSSTLQSAVDYAWNKGAVVFACAMNNSNSTANYPAACDKVVAVSATNEADTLAGFSSYGSWITLSAPGNNILTTNNGGGYGYWYGTSFASPITAGAAALVLALRPSLSSAALVNLLQNNSDDLGAPGYDTSFGWGRVNVSRVVSAASSLVVTPPSVSISAPSADATVSGTVTVSGTSSGPNGIASVQLSVDGKAVSTVAGPSFSFSWASGTVTAGSHTLTVTASDSTGLTGSASVPVRVLLAAAPADGIAPTVEITSPVSGSRVSKVTSIKVSASDNAGVTQVAIYVDGVQVYTGSAAPYSTNWNTRKLASGTHIITAKAWDAAGNSGSAASVSVTK